MIDAVVLALAAFPASLAAVNLVCFRAPRPLPGPVPPVSVLIPARNEEAHIGDAVRAVLASKGVAIELLVLDDGSTDGTRRVLDAVGDPRFRVISGGRLPAGWSGKQHACAMLARAAKYDLFVFLDADVRIGPDAVRRAVSALRGDIGLASGFPRQVTKSWSEKLLLPLIHLLLLGYLPMVLMRLFSTAPGFGAGCGQFFVARRDAYERAGGHGAIRTSLHDGITLPRAFRRAGIGTDIFDASSFACCRMYRNAREVWEGLSKNATEGMATWRSLPVWTLLLGGGHILPALLAAFRPSPAIWAALGCTILLRLVLALRFRQTMLGVLLHPGGVGALLLLQWSALLRAARGRPTSWRGRAYPAAG